MNFLDRLERRFGGWAVPQFALFIVLANGLIYAMAWARPEFLSRLMLNPQAIREGELWRLITFLFVPPGLGPIWMAFWLLTIYQFAQALEQEWGEFKLCLFYAIGALATIIAALALGETLSNVPLNTTLFLAFATLFPEFEMLIFFIIPVKVKYLAYVTWVFILLGIILGGFLTRISIAASLANYALFFGPQLWENLKLKVEVYRNRRRFRGE